jgi:hypothetical protein
VIGKDKKRNELNLKARIGRERKSQEKAAPGQNDLEQDLVSDFYFIFRLLLFYQHIL